MLSSPLSGRKCSNDIIKDVNGLNHDGVVEIYTEVWESLECLQLVLNAAAVMFGEREVGRMALE